MLPMQARQLLFLIFLCASLSSCARLIDAPKVILGTSTAALEELRYDAIVGVYRCDYDECYQAILDMARLDEKMRGVNEEGYFNIFQHDPVKGIIVVMGIPGNVDTTEVGIFLTMLESRDIKIEISSKSSSAKRKVARVIFQALNLKFEEV